MNAYKIVTIEQRKRIWMKRYSLFILNVWIVSGSEYPNATVRKKKSVFEFFFWQRVKSETDMDADCTDGHCVPQTPTILFLSLKKKYERHNK